MKLIKLSDTHYVVVDDSEIKEGDYCCHLVTKNIARQHNNSCYGDWKKVTHSTQAPDNRGYWASCITPITLQEVKELIGEVDVEKKVLDLYNKFPLDTMEAMYPLRGATKRFVESVYNQALEDNKEKKWTDEDVIRIVEKSRQTGLTAEYLMLSLYSQTEWEVEIIEGKLKLKS